MADNRTVDVPSLHSVHGTNQHFMVPSSTPQSRFTAGRTGNISDDQTLREQRALQQFTSHCEMELGHRPVDGDDLPRNISSAIRCKEGDQIGNFFGGASALHRHHAVDGFLGKSRLGHW